MSLEHLEEFEADVRACREAGDNMLASVRVRALRAAYAEIGRQRAAAEVKAALHSDAHEQLNALREAVKALYMAGRWTVDGMPADEQAVLWERLRDLCGIEPGTETARAASAPVLPAQAVPNSPLEVFAKGLWVFTLTGQHFSGAELDAVAFAKYRDYMISASREAQAVPEGYALVEVGVLSDRCLQAAVRDAGIASKVCDDLDVVLSAGIHAYLLAASKAVGGAP